MPTVLTRDQIKAIDDRKIEWVDIPEWHTDEVPDAGVFVRGLSGVDRDAFEMAMIDQRAGAKGKRPTTEINLSNLRAKLVARTAVDSDDPDTAQTIFTVSDVEWLGRKSGAALQRIYAKAQSLSGLSAEDVEELTAGLGEDQSGVSGSGSPLISATSQSPNASSTSAAESSPSGESSTPWSPSGSEG